MAALALVGAIMTGCTNEDNVIDNPLQPESKSNIVTLTTTVGFDGGASTRALTPAGVKTFADGDRIAVIYKNTSGETVKAVSAAISSGVGTASATFSVTLTNPDNTKAIRYIYPAAMAKATVATDATIDDDGTVDFTKLNSQNGSLTTLGSSLDLCTLDAANWTSGTLPNGTLTNQLAILAITVKDNATPTANDITNTITSLSVGDGTNVYSVTGLSSPSTIYVAIKPTTSATIGVNASDGTTRYYKELTTTKTYAASNGYSVSWKMNEGGAHLSALAGDYTAQNGETLKGTLDATNYPIKISIAAGATVTLNGVTINGTNVDDDAHKHAGITCLGDATVILNGTNVVRGFYDDYPGIYVPEGKTLTIEGTASDKLTATPWDNGEVSYGSHGAGIGGGYELPCGNIVIQGGDITAKGGYNAAGIGGGYNAVMGNINISGGKVTATGGGDSAGIGSGRDGNKTGTVANITISGADTEVTANGGYGGAGIGTGGYSENVAITINGGKVTANGGTSGAGIGSGSKAICEDININDGDIKAQGGNEAAGIGTGCAATCKDITISKGTVEATGGTSAAGIGNVYESMSGTSSCGDITIKTTVTKVTATKGLYARNCIGNAGYTSTCGTVTIGYSSGVNTDNSPYVYQP